MERYTLGPLYYRNVLHRLARHVNRSQRTLVIWKSKEYMPENRNNTCFTPDDVKYRYAMRTSSDLYREVLDDRKIFVIIFGEHYGVCQVPANSHCIGKVFRCMSVYIRTLRVTHLKDNSILDCVYVEEMKK